MRISNAVLQNLRAAIELPEIDGGRCRMIEKIGSGGMGTVFLANDLELNREVAIKVMDFSNDDPALAERMIREARIIARLEHPGIVPIHDVGRLADGRVYYAMKLVRGDRLDECFVAEKPLNEKLRVFQRVCEALAFAHAQNVIHRDVKPENIMLGAYGEVLLMDWGLAKRLNGDPPEDETQIETASSSAPQRQISPDASEKTLNGQVLGTPAYMSPEQAAGQIDLVDHRSDIFALGGVLKFLLTGDAENRKPAPQSKLRDRFSSFRKRLPKPLLAIAEKALSTQKSLRYDSALAMSEDIEAFLDDQPVSACKENLFEVALRWSRQNKFILILVWVYMLSRILLAFFLQS